MINSQKNFFIALILLGYCIGLYLFGYLKDLKTNELIDYKNNVNVELFGSLVDIIIFGILFYAIQYFFQKKEKIEFLKEQIDDFRDWDEKEASYRIIGIIKRLHKLGVDDINLSRCHFKELNIIGNEGVFFGFNFKASDLTDTTFTKTKINNPNFNRVTGNYIVDVADFSSDSRTIFTECELRTSSFSENTFYSFNFIDTKIVNGKFIKAQFYYLQFRGCIFEKIEFKNTSFNSSSFHNMDITNANFENVRFNGCTFINSQVPEQNENIIFDEKCKFENNIEI